jgi:hypothetical protein
MLYSIFCYTLRYLRLYSLMADNLIDQLNHTICVLNFWMIQHDAQTNQFLVTPVIWIEMHPELSNVTYEATNLQSIRDSWALSNQM